MSILRMLVRDMARVVGMAWFLSWFALYLEVFRYQHVVLTGLYGVIWPSPWGPQPGGFVRTVVVCSLVSPALCVLFFVWHRLVVARQVGRSTTGRRHVWPAMFAMFGAGLTVLGGLNQVLRQPPLVIDLTLRTGNGGFAVLGVLMAITGVICSRQTGFQEGRL